MMYSDALRTLREPRVAPVSDEPTPTRGIVPSRVQTPSQSPSVDSEDPLELVRTWTEIINESGAAVRSQMALAKERNVPKNVETVAKVEEVEDEPYEMEEKSKGKRKSIFGDRAVSFDSEEYSGPIGTLMQLMDEKEGGGSYSTLFGHSQKGDGRFAGVDVSKMTIGEIKKFASPDGEYGAWVKDQVGRVATPMGRYQFVGSTLKSVASEMGLPDDTVFDAKTQDAMFDFYLNKRLSAGSTIPEKVEQLRGAWEGFKSVPTARLAAIVRNLS